MILGQLYAFLFILLSSFRSINALSTRAPHFSFAGVNHPHLALLGPEDRDKEITRLVAAGTRVIRLFVTGDKSHEDFEIFKGVYDEAILNKFDATLGAIHRISKGKTRVIIAPHDVHSLRETNGAVCDAFCKSIKPSWLSFYIDTKMREYYKVRLTYMFARYQSRSFPGETWSDLGRVIMGVDLQNEPFSGVYPIPGGESWLCDIATHLKEAIGLGGKNIAVITGGISGYFAPGSDHNWPNSVYRCDAVDVIGIHGKLSEGHGRSAASKWANLFNPGNTLMGRMARRKLFLVESLSHIENDSGKSAAELFDQTQILNYRGIPWMFSHAAAEVMTYRVSEPLSRAATSPSHFDWARFIKAPQFIAPVTHIAPPADEGLRGSLGTVCDAMDGCQPDLVCKNNICETCTLGCAGMVCNSAKPCQEQFECLNGVCQECMTHDTAIPMSSAYKVCPREHYFSRIPICAFCDKRTSSCRGAPCEKPSDCSTDEFCNWGICKPCTNGCMGHVCKVSRDCKTGYCNYWKRCDLAPKVEAKKPNTSGGRLGLYGPGTEGRRRGGMQPGYGPQPVAPGNVAHSRGAGEGAQKAKATGTRHLM